MTQVDVVVGGQYGSEAKGHVTAQIIRENRRTGGEAASILNVRVAGPNAGHTVMSDGGGREWRERHGYAGRDPIPVALRSLPVGLVADDRTYAWIAPGSEVDAEVLADELERLQSLGVALQGRLFVSGQATVLEQHHRDREMSAGLTVGSGNSTGKGIGAARADRAMRLAGLVKDSEEIADLVASVGGYIGDPDWRPFDSVVIEGTQGYGLGLHAGHYPKCTSSDCRAIDFLAMAGISPWDSNVEDFGVFVVARSYPIRIAGNSGLMARETSWAELGLPEELTTVTKKVRRVGHWDTTLVKNAIRANGGAWNEGGVVRLVITMADQRFRWAAGLSDGALWLSDANEHGGELGDWLEQIATETGCIIAGVTTGPDTITWIGS